MGDNKVENKSETIEEKIGTILKLVKIINKKVIQFPMIKSTGRKGAEYNIQIKVFMMDVNDITTNVDFMRFDSIPMKLILNDWYDSNIIVPPTYHGYILVDRYINEGKKHEVEPTVVKAGKNIGKKNATNILTQTLLDAYSKHKHYIDRNAVDKKEGVVELYPPMLAQKRSDVESYDQNHIFDESIESERIFAQPKFNGIRAVITLTEDRSNVIIYSRTLMQYKQFDYIRDEAKRFLLEGERILNYIDEENDKNKSLDDQINAGPKYKLYIDGEMYLHGAALQDISGTARKKNSAQKLELYFYCYDCFVPLNPGIIFEHRNFILANIFENLEGELKHIKQVDTILITQEKQIKVLYDKWIKEKFEGLMIRKNVPYVYSYKGFHSSALLKVKPKLDSEFPIVGFEKATKGKAAGCLMWICEVDKIGDSFIEKDKRKTFTITPVGTLEERKELYKKLSSKDPNEPSKTIFETTYLGKPMTIAYDELSQDGKPLRGNAIAVRDYE